MAGEKLAMTEYLIDYLYYIGIGQMVDLYQNEVAFKEAAAKWGGSVFNPYYSNRDC